MSFSVIIPSFNSSKTLRRSLTSVANQSYKPSEVIIVDDNSSDYQNSIRVIDDFKSNLNIKIFRNEINRGAAFSRNVGIEHAQSKYIAFIDSDDTWDADRLESAKNIIDELPHQKFIIYGRFEIVSQGKISNLYPHRPIRNSELVSEYVFAASQLMQTSTFICTSEVAEEIKFDINLTRHQDSDFMMRAQSNNIPIIYQNKKCASYFFSHNDFVDRIKSGRINEKFCIDWLQNKSDYFNYRAIAGYNINVFSRILFLQGYRMRALVIILKSLPKLGTHNFIDLVKTKLMIVFGSRFFNAR